MANNERQKALDKSNKQIEKDFGKGSIMKLGEEGDTKLPRFRQGHFA